MTEDELTAQLEAMRDNPASWGDPVQPPKERRRSERRQRGAIVSVRFSTKELETVQAHAVVAGMSLSGYLRDRALADARQPVVTMAWAADVVSNVPGTEERMLVRASRAEVAWLPGSSLVGDI